MERKNFLKKLLIGCISIIAIPSIFAKTIKPKFLYQHFYLQNPGCWNWMECEDLDVYIGLKPGTFSEHIFTREEWKKYKVKSKSKNDYEEIHIESSLTGSKNIRFFDGIKEEMPFGYRQFLNKKDIDTFTSIESIKQPLFSGAKSDLEMAEVTGELSNVNHY